MSISQKQIDEVCEFQANLNKDDEYYFFRLALGANDRCTYEDKYEIMLRWNEFK